jgi:anti-anti-sigma regulatory factor
MLIRKPIRLDRTAGKTRTLSPHRLPLDLEEVDGRARFIVHESHLDDANVRAIGERFFSLPRLKGRLEVDLGNVTSLSDSCLGGLIALDRRLRAAGKHLSLADVTPEVYEVFEVTHLTTVLDIHVGA